MLDERKDRGIDMFAASTYEEIERIERQVENMEIVVFLFARPTEEKILKEFEYIHYNSARYCSIYAIGYTDDFTKAEDRTYRKVDAMMQQDWYFSMKAFTGIQRKTAKSYPLGLFRRDRDTHFTE